MPSSTGYLTDRDRDAAGLFILLWWMLVRGGDEAPWLPAGLAASVVLLVALSAREVVMRRAWTRYLLENGIHAETHLDAVRAQAAVVRRKVSQRRSIPLRCARFKSSRPLRTLPVRLPKHISTSPNCVTIIFPAQTKRCDPAVTAVKRELRFVPVRSACVRCTNIIC